MILGGAAMLMGLLTVLAPPGDFGLFLAVVAVGLVAVLLGLSNPLLACLYLLFTSFFRQVEINGVPVEPVLAAFGGFVLSVSIWLRRHENFLQRIGLLEGFVVLYVLWNVGSMLSTHAYAAIYPMDDSVISVPRFILFGTAMPLTALVLSRMTFGKPQAMRVLVFAVIGFAAYSALVSILSEWAPSLVWPRYVVTAAIWPERAVGVFNQPVVNGLVLVMGYLASLLVASRQDERPVVRLLSAAMAPACLYSVYLTHTRSAMLGLLVVLVMGAVIARGWRTGFVVTLAVLAAAVVANWSTFTSSDRASGGVGSSGEIFDRLNMIATGAWALTQEPLTGWGIGRFPAVNTYHHKQWSPEVPWSFGYGLAAHTDLVGIGTELGLIGMLLWALVYGLAALRLVRTVQELPEPGHDRGFAVFALLSYACLLITGLTVDMRFFDFPNMMVLLLVGAALGRGETLRRRPSVSPPHPRPGA